MDDTRVKHGRMAPNRQTWAGPYTLNPCGRTGVGRWRNIVFLRKLRSTVRRAILRNAFLGLGCGVIIERLGLGRAG
jgi:hypothetical protein